MGTAHITAKKRTSKRDYFPTPPIATYSLIKNYSLPKRILEPAAGRGWISAELIRNGYDVKSKDLFAYDDPLVPIQTGEDFLLSERDNDVDGVVTNPPYLNDLPQYFLDHALSMYDFVAMFCRMSWLESERRKKLFEKCPFTRCVVMSSRVNCDENWFSTPKRQCGGMVAYCWFIWDEKSEEKMKISFTSPKSYVSEMESQLR